MAISPHFSGISLSMILAPCYKRHADRHVACVATQKVGNAIVVVADMSTDNLHPPLKHPPASLDSRRATTTTTRIRIKDQHADTELQNSEPAGTACTQDRPDLKRWYMSGLLS
jgi:hypothetical protein